jgi:exopolysaccharide biosynthesis polyprenyl glycosylphosphotransferase
MLAGVLGNPKSEDIGLDLILAGRDGDSMTRLLGQHIPLELVGMWLVEVIGCSLLLYALLSSGAADDGDISSAAWRLGAANQAGVLALTLGITSLAAGLYNADTYLRLRGLLVSTSVGTLLALLAVWPVGRAVGIDIVGLIGQRAPLALETLLACTLFLFGLRLAFSYALRANLFARRVLIVGSDDGVRRIVTAVQSLRVGFLDIAGIVTAEDGAAVSPAQLRAMKVWGVIITAEARDVLMAHNVLWGCQRRVRVYSDSRFCEQILRRIDVEQPGSDWRQDGDAGGSKNAKRDDRESGSRAEAVLQRLFDIALSLALLVCTLPLMLATAGLIRLDSTGPSLYRQERVGLHGRIFTVLKFRSMRIDAEARGPVWAAQRDPRVTRVGAFIRLVRIDELPQLINVLRGEMSFIGPRPERPHFVEQLERLLPFYGDRALVKPGLTGWAQVNYPYGASVQDARAKLAYDLYYVKHRSLLLDLLILFATVRVVLLQRGAR